ncbi:replication protein RepA [Nocardia anaemiae]|uniref:replication protein RepA n=1 Tax=Nocardia anaemiae TaxID=263910 RepID=UPI0007A43DB9|nr:replication protein RepA [Nocardia anaemiae]
MRGRACEDAVERIFLSVPGCNTKRNALDYYHSSEIDLIVSNERHPDGLDLWWAKGDQPTLLPSTVRLTGEFFDEVTTRPVPVDLGALRALRRSPCAWTFTPGSPSA